MTRSATTALPQLSPTGTIARRRRRIPLWLTAGKPTVHHVPPPARTHGPDLSSKKSRFTFNWPISWYNRAIRVASFLTVAEDAGGSFGEGLLPSLCLARVDFVPGG